jgi:citrate lyase subunit beta/citryl-CoA lyase
MEAAVLQAASPCHDAASAGKACFMVPLYKDWRPRRSALFVPAANARAVAKLGGLSSDCAILDLEDSVGPEELGMALANLRDAFCGGRPLSAHCEFVIRLPALGETAFGACLEAALSLKPDALLLPKVETSDDIPALARQAGPARLWAMIETPMALLALREICAAGVENRLAALVVGPNDLAKLTGVAMAPGRAAFTPWLMQCVAAARAHGLAVLDGVYNRFSDIEGLAAECAQGAAFGFDGKTLIHPAQIAAANAAFTPPPQAFSRARAIAAAFALPRNAGRGAIQIDGEMVERLHLEQALRLLECEDLFQRKDNR